MKIETKKSKSKKEAPKRFIEVEVHGKIKVPVQNGLIYGDGYDHIPLENETTEGLVEYIKENWIERCEQSVGQYIYEILADGWIDLNDFDLDFKLLDDLDNELRA